MICTWDDGAGYSQEVGRELFEIESARASKMTANFNGE
jgi:hypothetical protein